MDTNLLIQIIMIVSFAVCLLTFMLVAIELLMNSRRKRNGEDDAKKEPVKTVVQITPEDIANISQAIKASSEKEQIQTVEQPKEQLVEEVVVAQEEQEEDEEGKDGVWVNVKAQQTLEEKYAELDDNAKKWYNAIGEYAMTKEGVKQLKAKNHEDYKVGSNRIVRLTIKRGVVLSEFVLIDQNFSRFINDNKVAVKTAPTIIKIESEEAVIAAKNSIDIAMQAVEEEKLYKKEKAKEKRRLAREALKNQQ